MSGARCEALLEALGAYRAESPHDDHAISRFQSFPGRDDPFRRTHPEGHVTASAIVAQPSPDGFLLVFHRRLDRWLQPGVDRDGSLDRAVRKAVARLSAS